MSTHSEEDKTLFASDWDLVGNSERGWTRNGRSGRVYWLPDLLLLLEAEERDVACAECGWPETETNLCTSCIHWLEVLACGPLVRLNKWQAWIGFHHMGQVPTYLREQFREMKDAWTSR